MVFEGVCATGTHAKQPEFSFLQAFLAKYTLPETNSLLLKIDGWDTNFFFGCHLSRCELLVSGRVSNYSSCSFHVYLEKTTLTTRNPPKNKTSVWCISIYQNSSSYLFFDVKFGKNLVHFLLLHLQWINCNNLLQIQRNPKELKKGKKHMCQGLPQLLILGSLLIPPLMTGILIMGKPLRFVRLIFPSTTCRKTMGVDRPDCTYSKSPPETTCERSARNGEVK